VKIPRVRRRWVVLAVLVVVALATFRLLDQPLALLSYRVADPRTVVVTGHGAQSAWNHVTGVTETDATVTISVSSLEFLGFLPHTDAAYTIEVEVRLGAPVAGRTVIDGSTGFPISAEAG